MSSYGVGGTPRGVFGTNEGDTWLMSDYFNAKIQAEKGPGWRMCVTLLRNADTGKLEERYYTTDTPDLVREADEGHVRWVEARAAAN